MFNVLTDTFKAQLTSEYKKRKLIVWLIAFVSLQLVFFVMIVPSYIYLISTERDLQAENDTTKSGLTNSIDIGKTFKSTNDKLAILAAGNQSGSLSALVSKIVSLKSFGVQIGEITYNADTATATSTSSQITLRGIAANRDSLLSFSKRLSSDSSFSNINLPVSNFAKDKDIDFSMTFNADM